MFKVIISFFLIFTINGWVNCAIKKNSSLIDKEKDLPSYINKKRIGIVAAFPSPLGMFYENRAYLMKSMRRVRLFPENAFILPENVNEKITHILCAQLKTRFLEAHQFVPLPHLNPVTHLTGYLIEGIWGAETKMIFLKGLKEFFQRYKLDTVIAIVPVTYYVPVLRQEGSGMNLTFSNNKLYFSACYAVLIFSRFGNSYQKTYGSIKQVYIKSTEQIGEVTNGTYDQNSVNGYYHLFEEGFLPHLTQQIEELLNHKKKDGSFIKPKRPWYYFLPH